MKTIIELQQQDILLFDGDCGICTAFAEWIKKIDSRNRFLITPYQSIDDADLRQFGISHAQCSQRLYVLTRDGRTYGGAIGANFFFYQYWPWKIFVVLLYAVPVFLLIEWLVYLMIAKNRMHLSRWFGLKACGVDSHYELSS